MKILLVLLFSLSLAYGQEMANPVYIPKSKPGDELTYKKTLPELEKFLIDLKPGMCRVNEIKIEGRYFIVMGTYDFENNLNALIEKLRDANTFDQRIYVETKVTKFGGEMTNFYTIYALNLWK